MDEAQKADLSSQLDGLEAEMRRETNRREARSLLAVLGMTEEQAEAAWSGECPTCGCKCGSGGAR